MLRPAPAPRRERRRRCRASRRRDARRGRSHGSAVAADPHLERFRCHRARSGPRRPRRRRAAGARCRGRPRIARARPRSGTPIASNCVGAAADRGLQDEAPAGDRRQRADLLGEQHRVPQRQQEERARGTVAPLREQAAEDRARSGSRRPVAVAWWSPTKSESSSASCAARARSIIQRAPVRAAPSSRCSAVRRRSACPVIPLERPLSRNSQVRLDDDRDAGRHRVAGTTKVPTTPSRRGSLRPGCAGGARSLPFRRQPCTVCVLR